MYAATFDQGWTKFFSSLDAHVKEKVSKILVYPYKRHLKESY